ncbi:MAG: hypothetical protein VB106_00810, partial [Clostridiaceae bacterium]|nr:hypothetical protein [Clostridiaceae bacterium]
MLPDSDSNDSGSNSDSWDSHSGKDATETEPDENNSPSGDTGENKDGPNANSTNPTKPTVTPKPITPTPVPSVPVKPATPTPTPTVPAKPAEPAKPVEPTKPVKPTEPPKPTVPDRSDDDDDDSSGGSGGGHASYPAAAIEIIVPDYSHAGTEFEVKTALRNVKALEWTVSQADSDAKLEDFLQGTLDKNGGKITITKPGNYTLTATAKNYGGSTYTFAKAITVYPVYEIAVTTEPYAHTDQELMVQTKLSDNVKQQLNWHIYKDGNEVKWADTVIGVLSNTGGSIQIKDKGKYTLKATAFDETSQEFSGKVDIEVLPVVELSLQAPKTAHTDANAVITTETKELGELPVAWSVTKDGQEAALSDCAEGLLDTTGGSLRFKAKGVYKLTAAVIDQSGRVFTTTEEIKVYPVAAFSFTLPETAHTDKAVTVS